MSVKAYEDACLRAELFGQPVPNREDFLGKHKHLDVVEFEEVDIKASAENTAILDENLRDASGGLHELNTILNSTQTKINKLKGVCGSITNFFRVKVSSKDNLSYSSEPSYIGQTNYDQDYVPPAGSGRNNTTSINEGLGLNEKIKPRAETLQDGGGGINSALTDLEAMQDNEETHLVSKKTAVDIGNQVRSQMSKLDQMINQADRAQASLQHQNKEMRSFMR